jgi:hypothetical protein
MEAYQHGVKITCYDSRDRRFYPRLFTYSADYPEKCGILIDSSALTEKSHTRILMAGIRNLGIRPCPHCLVPMSSVHLLGTRRDRSARISLTRVDDNQRRSKISSARNLIYGKNYAVDSSAIQGLLKENSLVPTVVGIHSPFFDNRCNCYPTERLLCSARCFWIQSILIVHHRPHA